MGKTFLVEDAPLFRFATSETLLDANLDVIELSTDDGAFTNVLANDGLDLIFTDADEPGSIDGLALAHTASGRFPKFKAIPSSARPRWAEGLGALPFPSKPYDIHEVVNVMRINVTATTPKPTHT